MKASNRYPPNANKTQSISERVSITNQRASSIGNCICIGQCVSKIVYVDIWNLDHREIMHGVSIGNFRFGTKFGSISTHEVERRYLAGDWHFGDIYDQTSEICRFGSFESHAFIVFGCCHEECFGTKEGVAAT